MSSLHVTLSLFLIVLLLQSSNFSYAHRTFPDGITCGPQFGSADTPLVVPNPAISWANYAIYTCDDPVQWYEATVDAGQMLYFTVTVPEIERFRDARMSVAVIGPDLPSVEDVTGDEYLPDVIVNHAAQNELGITLFSSPEDQSTCDHLTSEMMFESSTVKNQTTDLARCHFYEPFGGSNLWVVLDEELAAPIAGTYQIAVFESNGMSTKASFACCDWPEDFLTTFSIPETECPVCGSSPDDNPAWSSLWYEHKSMEDYGGYPPFQKCDDSLSIELPQEDDCPPVVNNTEEPVELLESCTPHCSNGVCHSHNIYGDCTWTVDWILKPMLGNAEVQKIVLYVGDTVQFKHSTSDGLAHNLYQLLDESSLDTCMFDGSSELANVEQVKIGHELKFTEVGDFHYTCSIGCVEYPVQATRQSFCHCTIGQKLTIQVKDASEGMRCHSHGNDSHESYSDHDHSHSHSHEEHSHRMTKEDAQDMLTCDEGNVNAYIVEDSNYGASDNECSELCTPVFALSFMAGVEEGNCFDQGFTHQVEEKEVQPPGSPMPMNVMLYSSVASDPHCHCHSYEKIACPENESESDTLYKEHIEELETFCKGVIDGTETNCPYTCFQPMEVLHLHYLECPSRVVDSLYSEVDAIGMCHVGTTDVPGYMKSQDNCPTIDVTDSASKETTEQNETLVSEEPDEVKSEDEDSKEPSGQEGRPGSEEPDVEPDDSAAPLMWHGYVFVAAGFLLSL